MEVLDAFSCQPRRVAENRPAYVLDREGADDNGQNYDNFDIAPKQLVPQRREPAFKSASLAELARSADPGDAAELGNGASRGLTPPC